MHHTGEGGLCGGQSGECSADGGAGGGEGSSGAGGQEFEARLKASWLAKPLLEGIVAPAMIEYYKRNDVHARLPLNEIAISVDGMPVEDGRLPCSVYLRDDGATPLVRLAFRAPRSSCSAGISGGAQAPLLAARSPTPRATSSTAATHGGGSGVWQDCSIRLDIPWSWLRPRPGEFEMDRLEGVEDSKGHVGERGRLIVTNLRLIWSAHSSANVNLSLGFGTINQMTVVKPSSSRLHTHSGEALHIVARRKGSTYQFVFTNLTRGSSRLLSNIYAVRRAYDTSSLFRELKLRGAVIQDKQLRLLSAEQLYSRLPGVMNLAGESGALGTAHLTNVRFAWHADASESFNVSLPLMLIASVAVRQTKFGHALALSCSERAGSHTFGFQLGPPERLDALVKELRSLHAVFGPAGSPLLGIARLADEDPRSRDRADESPEQHRVARVARVEDDVEIVDPAAAEGTALDASAAYLADGEARSSDGRRRPPVLSSELGLAIEPLPDGITARTLWKVL